MEFLLADTGLNKGSDDTGEAAWFVSVASIHRQNKHKSAGAPFNLLSLENR